jgi:hypothetical protein
MKRILSLFIACILVFNMAGMKPLLIAGIVSYTKTKMIPPNS